MTLFLILAFLAAVVLLIAYVCYRMAFFASREEEENAERRKKGLPPLIRRAAPPDAKQVTPANNETPSMSSLEADMYEDTLEDLVEGGAF